MTPEGFRRHFGRDSDLVREAPGRVNLIGEHTDYNGGLVLPTAIPQTTRAEVARRAGRTVRAVSADRPEEGRLEYELGQESRRGLWIDYVQGVSAELARRNIALGGFDLSVTSRVPVGAGLSSSAALEISVARALRDLFRFELDDVELALVGQRAENDLVGAPVGVMDQMASSLAAPGTALLLDTRSLETERIEIPRAAEIVVIDSGARHDHARGEYRKRRAECEEAAHRLGVRQLRDARLDRMADIDRLPDPLNRRARHVVTEGARVLEAARALRGGDLEGLGRLFDASHDSQRDDFGVSAPAIEALVRSARAHESAYGARLTGGGFGGSVVILAREGFGADIGRRVLREAESEAPNARAVVPPGEDAR